VTTPTTKAPFELANWPVYPRLAFYDSEPVPFDWQPLLNHFQQQACLGSISEILMATPHSPQGAIAQAWSVAELIRHWPDAKF